MRRIGADYYLIIEGTGVGGYPRVLLLSCFLIRQVEDPCEGSVQQIVQQLVQPTRTWYSLEHVLSDLKTPRRQFFCGPCD